MVQQHIIQKIVFFVPNLCQNSQEDNTHHLCMSTSTGGQHSRPTPVHQVTYHNPNTNSMTAIRPWNSQATNSQGQFVTLSTTQSATVPPVTSYTFVKYAAPTTAPGSVPTGISPLSKPTPWTPLQLFVLEHELNDHPDNAFVKQLINDLCHGCFIGYKGPQFSYCATNLMSAY